MGGVVVLVSYYVWLGMVNISITWCAMRIPRHMVMMASATHGG